MSPIATSHHRLSAVGWFRILVIGLGAGYWTSNVRWVFQHNQNTPLSNHPTSHLQRLHEDPCTFDAKLFIPHLFTIPPYSNISLSSLRRNNTSVQRTTAPAAKDSLRKDQTPKEKYTPSPTWWKRRVPKLTRIWNHRTPSSWCTIEEDPPTPILLERGEFAESMIYIKTYKASSSTCEGVAWSIAHHVGRRLQQGSSVQSAESAKPCKAYTRHEFADKRLHARRNLTHSLMWTFVRHPAARDLSHVYHFIIGRMERKDMTSYEIQQHIEGKLKGRQTRYLVPSKGKSHAPLWPRNELRKNATELIEYMRTAIMENYDFIGMTERMTESLAVMVLLWDLQPEDVVVLNSKRSGGYDDGGHNNTCTAIPKAIRTPELEEYFQNRHAYWNADILLYHAVNASLELTIDHLGRDKVHDMAQTIQQYQQYAQEQCESEAIYPCSPDGKFQPELAETSCYVQDAGCGHKCVDRVSTEMRARRKSQS